jgi:hypothetical protein
MKRTVWLLSIPLLFFLAFSAAHGQDNTKPITRADYDKVLVDVGDDALFQEFLNKLPTIETGEAVKRRYYVLEGDWRLTREEVRARLYSYVSTPSVDQAQGVGSEELYVMKKNGVLAKWPVGQRALTYAIKRSSFSTAARYDEVVQNFPKAAADWINACQCGLSFTHLAQHDGDPKLADVTFIVTFVPNDRRFIALAFFPTDPVDQRYLHIMEPYFTNQTYDKVGMLRHEIGHILGYRHSHIGGVAGCEYYEEEDKGWQALSGYYWQSAMHYPCGEASGSTAFNLSDRDKADHKKYYSD